MKHQILVWLSLVTLSGCWTYIPGELEDYTDDGIENQEDDTGEDDTDIELRNWTAVDSFLTVYNNDQKLCTADMQFYKMDDMMEADSEGCADCTHSNWVKLKTVHDTCWSDVGEINTYGFGLNIENEELFILYGSTWINYPEGLAGDTNFPGLSARSDWTAEKARLVWGYEIEFSDGSFGWIQREDVYTFE